MKSPIFALRQRKATLTKEAKAISDAAAREGRDLNDGEKQNHEKILKALTALEGELVAEEARLIELNSGELTPDENGAFARLAMNELPIESPSARPKGAVGRAKYADLFGTPSKSAFKSFGEFLQVAANANRLFDPRLRMAGQEDLPGTGGFLVQPELAQTVFDTALEGEIVRKRCVVVPMKSESRKWPYVVDKDHSSGVLFGTPGFAAGWGAELTDIDEGDMEIGLLTLTANRFGVLHNASQELLDDSAYAATLAQKFTQGCGWHIDNALLFGDGAGKPRGALSNHDALIVVDKESAPAQPADTILLENCANMFGRMNPGSVNNAIWLVTTAAIPQLLLMQNKVWNNAHSDVVGGSSVPAVQVADDGSMTLFTRPVVTSEKMAALGDQGDIAFIDFSQYCCGMRKEVTLESSAHAGFKNFSMWYRLVARLDGQPLWADVLKLKNGVEVSPFVTLEAR